MSKLRVGEYSLPQKMITPSQQRIIDYPYKPNHILRIDAGPGSGKTFTLLQKIEHLIEVENVEPKEILVLSLTNKSVENVRSHLNEKYRYDCCIKTFHSMANKLIKDVEGNVNVIDDNGWRALHHLYAPSKVATFKKLERAIIKYRECGELVHEDILKVLELMEKCNVYSQYDLIKESIKYIDTSKESNAFKVIIVDEYQDLYPFLIPFLKKISANSQLIMFGDINQSIYQFLGNNTKAIESIGVDEVLELKDNFRTTPEIMDFISSNRGACTTQSSPNIKVFSKPPCNVPPLNYNNDLIGEISKLICCGVDFQDIAILTRTNDSVVRIVDKLNACNIPNEKILKYSKFTTTLIDLMRLSVDLKNNNVNNEFNRILVLQKKCDWDLKDKTIGRLDRDLRFLHTLQDPIELIKKMCQISFELGNKPDKTIYKFAEIMKICSTSVPPEMTLVEWFFEKGLDVTLDSSDENSIKVSTIHASKGLEYPIVFVDKLELPWMVYGGKGEEKNVKYVACTRARNLLYLNNQGLHKHDILQNKPFWDYYYKDLSKPNRFNQLMALKNFQKISQKLGSVLKR